MVRSKSSRSQPQSNSSEKEIKGKQARNQASNILEKLCNFAPTIFENIKYNIQNV